MTAAWIVPLVVALALPLAVAVRRITQAWTQAEAVANAEGPIAPEGDALESAVPDVPA